MQYFSNDNEPGGPIVPNVGASANRWRYFTFRRYFNLSALKIVRKGNFVKKHNVFSVVSVIELVLAAAGQAT